MIFRGMTEEGKRVKGYYFRIGSSVRPDEHLSYIIVDKVNDNKSIHVNLGSYEQFCCYKIIPESLSMSTGQVDMNKEEIFGSIEYEKGKMSRGGDKVKLKHGTQGMEHEGNVIWGTVGFYVKGLGGDWSMDTPFIEIIGNQFEEQE